MFPKHMHTLDIIPPPTPLKTESTLSLFNNIHKRLESFCVHLVVKV